MNLDWEDFRFVLALARAKTLTTAARQLDVSHTTVKRRVASLEAQLGTRLFEHLPTGYVLSSAGAEVVAVASHIEEQVLSLDRSVLGRDAQLRGPLRVTTVGMIACHHANDIGAFVQRYPHIELELCASYQPASLTKREADVAIRLSTSPPEHLIGRRVGRLEYAVFAAKSLLEKHGIEAALSAEQANCAVESLTAVQKQQLSQLPWLAWNERMRARGTEAWMKQQLLDPKVVARMDMGVVIQEALRQGVGAMLLPASFCRRYPEVSQLSGIFPKLGVDIWLLTHQDLRATARVTAFNDYMAEVLLKAHPILFRDAL